MFGILVMGIVCGVLTGTVVTGFMDKTDIESCGVEF